MATMTNTRHTWGADSSTGGAMVAAASLAPSSVFEDFDSRSRRYYYYQSLLPSQLLIRFQNRTFVWNNDCADDCADADNTDVHEHSRDCSAAAAAVVWKAVILSFISGRIG